MPACATSIGQALAAFSGWELVAVVLAVAYLLLAMRQSIWCWYAAFISTAIFTYLYWDVSLYMESALNVYYIGMAVFGWWQWRGGISATQAPIIQFTPKQHGLVIGVIVLTTLVSGYILQHNTDARLPYADSFSTWGAVVTTYMVAKKVLDNWLYWLVINSVGIYLNIDRCLLLTAALLCGYQVISVAGYINWRKEFNHGAGTYSG